MAGKLAETYPMFRGRAGRRTAIELLAAGRVAAFLDGLDEIPESVRPGVLEALADAPFRLVLLSRTEEAVGAARHGPLAGAVAVELQPVRAVDAAAYLREPLVDPPPAGWRAIGDRLVGRPGSVLSKALATPLTLSLLRDVYGPAGPVEELLDESRFRSAADIENHVLDQAIPAAYACRPGHPAPPYSAAVAERTLRYLATRLTEQHTADLAWWHIPTWMPHRSRMAGIAAISILGNQLLYGLPIGLVFGPALGLLIGLVVGLMGIVGAAGELAPAVPMPPQRIGRFSYRSTSPGYGLLSGLVGGVLAGLPAGLVFGLSAGLAAGGSVGLVSAFTSAFLRGLVRTTEIEQSSLDPAGVWRQDRNSGLVLASISVVLIGLLAALTAALVPGLAAGVASRMPVVIIVGLTVGLVWGLGIRILILVKRAGAVASPGSAASDVALAAVRLRFRYQTPLHLMAFLEDARSRHLLRTVGPVYQFRHATLQHRLAESASERS